VAGARFELVASLDADGVYRVRFAQADTPPADLALPLGDMLGNLRAALDYLVWQLVLVNGGTPTTRSAFPVIRKAAAWPSVPVDRLAGVAADWVAVIEALQPYHSDSEAGSVLDFLDQTNNINKHRMMAPVAISHFRAEPSVRLSGPAPGRTLQMHLPKRPRVEAGALLLGVELRPVDPGITLELHRDHVHLGIAFDHGIGGLTDFPDLVRFVSDVVDRFEPAFPQIGR